MISFKKMKEEAKRKKVEREWIARIHHVLMKEYGWIPLEEFKRLPMTTILSLLDQIDQQREEERIETERQQRKAKSRKPLRRR